MVPTFFHCITYCIETLEVQIENYSVDSMHFSLPNISILKLNYRSVDYYRINKKKYLRDEIANVLVYVDAFSSLQHFPAFPQLMDEFQAEIQIKNLNKSFPYSINAIKIYLSLKR